MRATRAASLLAAVAASTLGATGDGVDTFTLEPSTATPMTGTAPTGVVQIVGTAGQSSSGAPLTGVSAGGLSVEVRGGFWSIVLNEILAVLWNPRGDNSFFNAQNWDYEGTPGDDNELPTEADVVKLSTTSIVDINLTPPSPQTAVIGALQVLGGIFRFNFSHAALVLAGSTEPAAASLLVKAGAIGETEAKFESFSATGVDQLIASAITLDSDSLAGIGRLRLKSSAMSLLHDGPLIAGIVGRGEFIVENGADATSLGDARLASTAQSQGDAFVRNAGSSWLVLGNSFTVGDAGKSTLTIQSGGLVETSTDQFAIGLLDSANGSVLLSDSGSVLHVNGGAMTIGDAGQGTVSLNGAAHLDVDFATQLAVGATTGSSGLLAIGQGATADVTASSITLGSYGNGYLSITGGAVLTTTVLGFQPIEIAASFGSTGIATISGAGSRWSETTSTGSLRIGVGGSGTVALDGGTLDIPSVTVFPNGQITGSGTIIGDVLNVGTLKPTTALQVGQITIDGDYQQAALSGSVAGSLAAVASGNGALPTGIVCTGDADLSGGLLIQGGLTAPSAGQSYTVVAAASVNGTFGVTYVDGIPNLRAAVQYPAADSKGGSDVTIAFETLPNSSGLGAPAAGSLDFLPTGGTLANTGGGGQLDLALAIPASAINGARTGNTGLIQVLYDLTPDGVGGISNSGLVEIATGTELLAIAAGDLDGDGLNDVIAADGATNGSLKAFRSTGTGFQPLTNPAYLGFNVPAAVATAHLNGDNRADLIVGSMGDDTIRVLLSVGPSSYTVQTIVLTGGSVPCTVDPVDIDGDSDIDIAAAMAGTNKVYVFLNQGNGVFSNTPSVDLDVGAKPVVIVARDVDGVIPPGFSVPLPDLLTLNKNDGTVSVLINKTGQAGGGPGAPVQIANAVSLPVGLDPRAIAFLDEDEDGDLDFVVAVTDQGVSVARKVRNDLAAGQANFNGGDAIAGSVGTRLLLDGDLDANGTTDLLLITAETGGVASDVVPPVVAAKIAPNKVLIPGDLNGDGTVNGADLGILLGGWGICRSCSTCPGDIDGDCAVTGTDLAILLGSWGTP